MCLGDLDRRVLRALLANGRANAAEVAESTGLAEATVEDVRAGLEASDVITGYRPRIDHGRIGYDVTAILEMTPLGEAREAARDCLESLPEVVDIYEVAGETRLVAIAKFPAPAVLDARTRQLLTDPSIASLSVHVVLETHVENRHPSIPEGT